METHYVEITEDTFIGGDAAPKGKKFAVDESTLKQLARCKRGKECEPPKNAASSKAKAVAVEE